MSENGKNRTKGKEESPLVSVIIPVYNVLPYLKEALDSVIHQTYHNLEIIIIDDGSTDGSSAVCDEYLADPRVKVIHQENRGLSGARNTGLDIMTGDYVAFLDPDDAFYLEMIEIMVSAVIEQKADMAECGYDVCKTKGKLTDGRYCDLIKPEKEEILSSRDMLVLLLKGCFSASVWNKLYTSDIWKNLRFPEGYVYEDLRILPFVLNQCNHIAVVPKILVYHRVRKGSITQTGTIQNFRDYIEAKRFFLDYIEKYRPSISSETISLYRDNTLRSYVISWAELRKLRAPKDSLFYFKQEISTLANKTEITQKKTKAAWWLFRYCPRLLLPVRACFRQLKILHGRRVAA